MKKISLFLFALVCGLNFSFAESARCRIKLESQSPIESNSLGNLYGISVLSSGFAVSSRFGVHFYSDAGKYLRSFDDRPMGSFMNLTSKKLIGLTYSAEKGYAVAIVDIQANLVGRVRLPRAENLVLDPEGDFAFVSNELEVFRISLSNLKVERIFKVDQKRRRIRNLSGISGHRVVVAAWGIDESLLPQSEIFILSADGKKLNPETVSPVFPKDGLPLEFADGKIAYSYARSNWFPTPTTVSYIQSDLKDAGFGAEFDSSVEGFVKLNSQKFLVYGAGLAGILSLADGEYQYFLRKDVLSNKYFSVFDAPLLIPRKSQFMMVQAHYADSTKSLLRVIDFDGRNLCALENSNLALTPRYLPAAKKFVSIGNVGQGLNLLFYSLEDRQD